MMDSKWEYLIQCSITCDIYYAVVDISLISIKKQFIKLGEVR